MAQGKKYKEVYCKGLYFFLKKAFLEGVGGVIELILIEKGITLKGM